MIGLLLPIPSWAVTYQFNPYTGKPDIVGAAGSTNVGVGTGSPNYFVVYTGSTTVGPANQVVHDSSGNVGIGSIVPIQKLDVAGGANFSGVGNVGIGTNVPAQVLDVVGTGRFSTGLFVTSGNVGIGTVTPGTTLDVPGSIRAGTLNIANGKLTINPSGIIETIQNTTSASIRADVFNMASSGNAKFQNNSAGTGDGITINGSVGGTLGNNITLTTSTGSTTNDRIRFTGSGGTIMQMNGAGNVGIGTVNTGSKLGIVGGVGIGTIGAGDTYLTAVAPNGGMIIEGNIGLGSTAPQAKLDLGISGTIVSHSTTGVGVTIKTAANQACNTTCGGSACWAGFDNGTVGVANSQPVDCTDATADRCECLGP